MKKTKLYIIGASGHAKAVMDMLPKNWELLGFFDDNAAITELKGYPVTHPIPEEIPMGVKVLTAIGHNAVREKISNRYRESTFTTLIHPSAIISKSVAIGSGTIIMEGAIIKVDSVLGNQVLVNTRAVVDHDCIIGDFVHLAPGTTLCGNVEVGSGTLVGAGTVVIPGIKIGKNCIIAAGSTVHKNVPDGGKWIGSSLKKS